MRLRSFKGLWDDLTELLNKMLEQDILQILSLLLTKYIKQWIEDSNIRGGGKRACSCIFMIKDLFLKCLVLSLLDEKCALWFSLRWAYTDAAGNTGNIGDSADSIFPLWIDWVVTKCSSRQCFVAEIN